MSVTNIRPHFKRCPGFLFGAINQDAFSASIWELGGFPVPTTGNYEVHPSLCMFFQVDIQLCEDKLWCTKYANFSFQHSTAHSSSSNNSLFCSRHLCWRVPTCISWWADADYKKRVCSHTLDVNFPSVYRIPFQGCYSIELIIWSSWVLLLKSWLSSRQTSNLLRVVFRSVAKSLIYCCISWPFPWSLQITPGQWWFSDGLMKTCLYCLEWLKQLFNFVFRSLVKLL